MPKQRSIPGRPAGLARSRPCVATTANHTRRERPRGRTLGRNTAPCAPDTLYAPLRVMLGAHPGGLQALAIVGHPTTRCHVMQTCRLDEGIYRSIPLQSATILRVLIRTTTPLSPPRTSTCTTSRSRSAPSAPLAPAPGASSRRPATRRRTRRRLTTTTLGAHPALNATSRCLLASPCSAPTPTCCATRIAVGEPLTPVANIPLALALCRRMTTISGLVYVGLT